MDESYLTGEPYMMSKTPGSTVLSGAINGESALTIRADKLAVDSRYAKIMQVMQVLAAASTADPPAGRSAGRGLHADRRGAWASRPGCFRGDPVRFLAVMVVATPCPLLIAIPVAIIGSISLAARRAIIVRDPAVLEQVDTCQTMIFDKTGTLTYGEPQLTEQLCAPGRDPPEVLSLVASLEQYSKHPLAEALVAAGRQQGVMLYEASQISERPGEGLRGIVAGQNVRVTSRQATASGATRRGRELLPPQVGGLECVILIDGDYAATYRFRDTPRREGASVRQPLGPPAWRAASGVALGRPRIGSPLPGRSGRHSRFLWRAESGRQAGVCAKRNGTCRTRSSWATASTTHRP